MSMSSTRNFDGDHVPDLEWGSHGPSKTGKFAFGQVVFDQGASQRVVRAARFQGLSSPYEASRWFEGVPLVAHAALAGGGLRHA
jgi:hypothetical protein